MKNKCMNNHIECIEHNMCSKTIDEQAFIGLIDNSIDVAFIQQDDGSIRIMPMIKDPSAVEKLMHSLDPEEIAVLYAKRVSQCVEDFSRHAACEFIARCVAGGMAYGI